MNPENLITKIRNGDKQAFEDLYKEYYPRLYSYVFGYIKNKEDSKEIVHDTFITLWNKKDSLPDDLSVYAWLFTVVKNHCLNQIRKKSFRIDVVSTVDLTEIERSKWQAISLESFIPEEIKLSELQQIIDNAIRKMPSQCRQIFVMSRYHGASHKEISEKLNITTKTIENQITKAIKIIKKHLDID